MLKSSVSEIMFAVTCVSQAECHAAKNHGFVNGILAAYSIIHKTIEFSREILVCGCVWEKKV
jgi:hypothetical protein